MRAEGLVYLIHKIYLYFFEICRQYVLSSNFSYLVDEYSKQIFDHVSTFFDYFALFRNLKSRTQVIIREVMLFLVTSVGKITKLQHKHFCYQNAEFYATTPLNNTELFIKIKKNLSCGTILQAFCCYFCGVSEVIE